MLLAVVPALDIPLPLFEVFDSIGKLWLCIAAVQLVGILSILLNNSVRSKVELGLNIVPMVPIFFYFYMTAPIGAS